jgi:CheY-like chemotaxis protein
VLAPWVVEEPLVLVVEDYDDVRELYVRSLEEAGFRVLSATNGDEALSVAKERQPAAIVMDLQMPVKDGWDAIREIRALGLGPRPYILAVTAHIGDGTRAQAYDAGADDFVAKPLDPSVLCTIVRASLRARQ